MQKLTIGMAVHSDFDGLVFTVQSLRMYHNWPDVELIVVDNDPDSAHGKMTRSFIENKTGGKWSYRYIPFTNGKGTAATRDLIFREGSGDVIMCMDSHVMLSPGSLYYLKAFYDQNPNSLDLIQGPLIYDDLGNYSTHFDDVWRGEMWGVWGTDKRGEHRDNPPFEIPAQGLGLFACKKTAWLGFNPNFKGFGGEEYYIHTKYKQAGRKTWCLPGLRWWHRFGRPNGVNYPLTVEDKLRNYLIGHVELNLALDRVHAHFVGEGKLPQETFDRLHAEVINLNEPVVEAKQEEAKVSAPENKVIEVKQKGCGCGKKAGNAGPNDPVPVENMLQEIKKTMGESGSIFKKLFEDKETVVELCDRRTNKHASILASGVKHLYSFANETLPEQNRATYPVGDAKVTLFTNKNDLLTSIPKEVYGVYIDRKQDADEMLRIVETLPVVVILVNGGQEAVLKFLENNIEWSVLENNEEGMFALVKGSDKELPSFAKKAYNFIKAVTKYARNGFGDASPKLHSQRYELCLLCPERNGKHCSQCGCPVKEKTSWESEECPLKKW